MAKETIVRWESDKRYYAARLQTDLFGDFLVARVWGGLGNNIGNGDQQLVADQAEGERLLESINRVRVKHKYRMVERREAD